MDKTHRTFLVVLVLISLNTLLVVDNTYAQPTVKLEVDPAIQTISIGIDIEDIAIVAQADGLDYQFTWQLDGPGELAGDKTSSGKFYIPPKKIDGESAQVTITVTVKDAQGRETTQGITFNIIVPTPTPSTETPIPTPTPPPSDITLLPVPAGTYTITDYLQRYIRYPGVMNSIIIAQPFSIQSGEVTVGEFRRYVNSLAETRREQPGTRWEMDKDGSPYPDNRPVENISWQEAVDYTKWLSEKTGWDLQLPTAQQWAAACIKYGNEERPVLNRPDNQPLSTLRGKNIDHLLGNLREWSADACGKEKYLLLGENYMTDPSDPDIIGRGYCVAQNEKWTGVGFRFVRIEH